MKKSRGFTLIELMIAVAIIGILAGIAYPSYQDSVMKSRRRDAQGALMGLANAMERRFTETNSYVGAAGTDETPADTGAPWIYNVPAETASFYTITISAANGSSYTLSATPTGAQAGNGVLTLKHTGERSWDRNDDGTVDDNEKQWN